MGAKQLAIGAVSGILVLTGANTPVSPIGGDAVRGIMLVARQGITEGLLADEAPIIPIEDAGRVVDTGLRSALAKWCDIEWQESSYLALMRHEPKKQKWSGKQLAYVGMLHGATLGYVSGTLRDTEKCSEKAASNTRADLISAGLKPNNLRPFRRSWKPE